MTVFLLREGGATAAAGQPVLAVVRAFEAFPGRTERLHHIHNLGKKKKNGERKSAGESRGGDEPEATQNYFIWDTESHFLMPGEFLVFF